MTDRERLKQIKNVKRKDLVDHYAKTHTTSNMRFVIAGNLKGRKPQIKKMLEAFGLAQRAQLYGTAR